MLIVSPAEVGKNPLKVVSCIWWWGFTSGYLGRVEYHSIAITLRPTLTRRNSTSSSPIVFDRTLCKEIKLIKMEKANIKLLRKYVITNVQFMWFSNIQA